MSRVWGAWTHMRPKQMRPANVSLAGLIFANAAPSYGEMVRVRLAFPCPGPDGRRC